MTDKSLGQFRRAFALDIRSLRLFRVALGALLAWDAFARLVDIQFYYDEQGVLPAWWVIENSMEPIWVSLYLLNPTWEFAFSLHVTTGLIGCLLVAGWRSRLMCFLGFLLLASLHSRNPLVLNSGDTLLRLALLYGAFLPLPEGFRKLDLGTESPPPGRFHLAGVALILQTAAVYGFAGISKTHRSWWLDRDAVDFVLQNREFATSFGLWFGETFPSLLPTLCLLVVAIELVVPFLLLLGPKPRLVALVLLALLHLSFLSMLSLGMFRWSPWVMILALIPSFVWDRGEESDPIEVPTRPIEAGLIVGLLVLVLSHNLLQEVAPESRVKKQLDVPVQLLRLDQTWRVFHPRPPQRWGVMRAVGLIGGEEVDLLSSASLETGPRYRSVRMRRYTLTLLDSRFNPHCERYLHWLLQASGQEFEAAELRYRYRTIPQRGEEPIDGEQILYRLTL